MHDQQQQNDSAVITQSNPRISAFLDTLERLDNGLDRLEANYRPALLGERYLTDKQLSECLHISRCTLQEHRNAGRIPYYVMGGKVLYKESEIDKLLKDNLCDIIA